MYKDEFRRQEKLKNLREEKSKEEDERIRSEAPFKPTFYSKSTKKRDYSTGRNIQCDFQERQEYWQKKVELKDQRCKDQINKEDRGLYTFNPDLKKAKLKDDEKSIVKIVDQSNQYVNRRLKCIKQQKENDEYYNKRMVINPNFKPHVTKQDDTKLSSAGSHEFMERLKRSKNCHTPDILNKARHDLKTNYFFRESYEMAD